MLIVSATGGSGSSFMLDSLLQLHWNICQRPDSGWVKLNRTAWDICEERTRGLMRLSRDLKNADPEELWQATYKGLSKYRGLVLGCMVWGGMGFLRNVSEAVIYVVRDPIYTFISYSGGGWRDVGGTRRIKSVGAKNVNDRIWIDAFFGKFSFWLDHCRYATEAIGKPNKHVIRYNKFPEGWDRIGIFPPLDRAFKCQNKPERITKFLLPETVEYIREITGPTWKAFKEAMNEHTSC